ncbi:MAG: ROK family protein [Hyphomonas sp.]
MLGAVEAGGTKIICATATAPGQIVSRTSLPTESPEVTFRRIREFFAAAAPLRAIGIGAFGPLDVAPASPGYGTVLPTPKPGWTGADWRAAFAGAGCPVAVDTDVNAAALGEYAHGAGRGCKTLAYVTVGTGIGAGILHAGQPLAGTGHYEMGHIYPPQDADVGDFPGTCSFHGRCLEGLASGTAIRARWGWPLSDLPAAHPAHGIVATYLAHLAVAITLTHMPDRILFGGGVMKAPGLMDRVRTATSNLLAGYVSHGPASGDLADYIQPPALGDDAGITGALILAERALA